ncbi:MAG: hypothetical protein NTX15_12170 [Candidatus Kapabacteria bacterium]|nr:hypothetical protein [Candidatus Kapabacteria bacterium]
MKRHTRVVWLGYASVVLAIVWGIGIVPALYAIRTAKAHPLGAGADPRIQRDLRGGLLIARAGLVLNIVVLAVIVWSLISTHL